MTAHRKAAMVDIGFGAFAAAGVAALMLDAADLADRARLFPVAVLWCLLIAALVILAGGLMKLRGDDGAGEKPVAAGGAQFLAPPLVVIAGGALLVWFGFYLTSPVFIVAMHALHMRLSTGAAPTGRMLLTGLALAVIATAVMYLIFDVLIGLPAPAGAIF